MLRPLLSTAGALSIAAVVGGCGNSAADPSSTRTGIFSAIVLHGTYIEGQTGRNLALYFNANGVNLYEGLQMNAYSGRYTGDCLAQDAQYELVGDTVRIAGGSLTPLGQAEATFTPQSGGNVVLLSLVSSGQEVDLTRSDGSILKFIRQ